MNLLCFFRGTKRHFASWKLSRIGVLPTDSESLAENTDATLESSRENENQQLVSIVYNPLGFEEPVLREMTNSDSESLACLND